jgi:hypothetical protein
MIDPNQYINDPVYGRLMPNDTWKQYEGKPDLSLLLSKKGYFNTSLLISLNIFIPLRSNFLDIIFNITKKVYILFELIG